MLSLFALISTLTIISLLTIISVVIVYLKWHFSYWRQRNINGPKPQLLKGTFPKTQAGECNLVEELHEIYLKYKSTEKYVGIFTARTPKLLILDPTLAAQILVQHFRHFHDNESSQWTTPAVEQLRLCSPFVTIGDAWKQRRSELSPNLTANRLRSFYAPMQDSATKLVQHISANLERSVDVKELANRFTAEFVANFIWGIKADAFNAAELSPIHRIANKMISQSLACVRYYARTAPWPWLRKFHPVRFFPAETDRFFQQLARESLQMHQNATTNRADVINHLLQLMERKTLNEVQIAGHTTTVLIDGFETGAILIAHCLLLLSRNKRVQDKLREELQNAGDGVSFDELNELPYLEQCLQETLRIFPPLPALFKLCTEAITLQNHNHNELQLKPNDTVYISSYSFHRDGDFYENPEDFWPERFDECLGGVRKYRDLGVFLPFGDGPRICPGRKLGLAEAKVAVAAVVSHFHMKSSENTRRDNKIAADSFLLTLDGGIELIFEKI